MDNAEAVMDDIKQDRRRFRRRKVLKSVQIVSLDKTSTLDCILRNLSPDGALICGRSTLDIPDRFYIRTASQLKLVSCEVVRRNLTSVAVRFEGDPGKIVDGNPS